jgi:hypothetical protein
MPRSGRAIAWLALCLGAGIGCAKLVGADFSDPPSVCAATVSGNARLRFGDFVPSLDRHDFCVSGGGLASVYDTAPQGIGYEQVLAPAEVPRGSYRIAAVLAGQGCDAEPLVTTTVCLDGGSTTTVLLLGDGVGAVQLDAFPESTTPTRQAPLRLIDAIANVGALDLGPIPAAALPADIAPRLFSGVGYGATARPGTSSEGAIDDNGYVALSPTPADLPLGAAPAGQPAATLLTDPLLVDGHRYTVVAAGSSADVRFPEELFVCDETQNDGMFTACGGFATEVTVDTFDPFLFGAFSFHDQLRSGPVAAAIAKLTSDVVCLPGVYSDGDKTAIAAAAIAHFPYSYWVADSFDTMVDDATEEDGGAPPPSATPPCAPAPSGLSELLSCLEASACSSAPGDPDATVAEDSLACITQSCGGLVDQLTATAPQCWQCVLGQLQSRASFATTTTECTSDPGATLGWGGASGVLLLSRYALKDSSEWVLPSTFQRASMLQASMAIQNAELDVYCGILEAPVDGTSLPYALPYTGAYANGAQTDADAWRQELLLQTQKAVAQVNARSGAKGRRAVVAGQWNTGPTEQGGAMPGTVLPPYDPESFAVLSAAFPQAAPAGYVPSCTFCANNPLLTDQTPPDSNAWGNYPVLNGIPVTDVVSASIILSAPVIPYLESKVPLSPIYGYRVTVNLRPR